MSDAALHALGVALVFLKRSGIPILLLAALATVEFRTARAGGRRFGWPGALRSAEGLAALMWFFVYAEDWTSNGGTIPFFDAGAVYLLALSAVALPALLALAAPRWRRTVDARGAFRIYGLSLPLIAVSLVPIAYMVIFYWMVLTGLERR
jgi:hypothetical protein